jgi:hypothetical protein
MSPFWASLFDELRGRGRNATLFIVAALLFLSFTVIAAQIPRDVYVDYVLPVLPWAALPVGVCLLRSYLKARAPRSERLTRAQLSRDELNKARSKLVKGINRKPL